MSPEEFAKEFGPEMQTVGVDTHPYGAPAKPVKTGLTVRGKAALAIGAAAIATSGLVGYQMYAADQAENETKAQEIAYRQGLLDLEKQKIQAQIDKANAGTSSARQKQIDACVKSNKDLVGKTLNSNIRDIVDACQAQYTDTTAGMQAAAATSSSGSGGASTGLLVAVAIGGLGVVVVARKATRSTPA